ncbi:hypothetical protein PLESTM_001561300 [Pleodorina starrii]|nr:hypothetical protein PLESTM_001561300 [Pleodorina starrii]
MQYVERMERPRKCPRRFADDYPCSSSGGDVSHDQQQRLGLLDMNRDLLLSITSFLQPLDILVLRETCRFLCNAIDGTRTHIVLHLAHVQQAVFLDRCERCAVATTTTKTTTTNNNGPSKSSGSHGVSVRPEYLHTADAAPAASAAPPPPASPPRAHRSRFLSAFDKWPRLRTVYTLGDMPESCIARLVQDAVAAGRLADLRRILLQQTQWPSPLNATAVVALVACESALLGTMSDGEAVDALEALDLPRPTPSAAAAAAAAAPPLGAADAGFANAGIAAAPQPPLQLHIPDQRARDPQAQSLIHWLAHFATALSYGGSYDAAARVARLLWAPPLADAVRATLATVLLARRRPLEAARVVLEMQPRYARSLAAPVLEVLEWQQQQQHQQQQQQQGRQQGAAQRAASSMPAASAAAVGGAGPGADGGFGAGAAAAAAAATSPGGDPHEAEAATPAGAADVAANEAAPPAAAPEQPPGSSAAAAAAAAGPMASAPAEVRALHGRLVALAAADGAAAGGGGGVLGGLALFGAGFSFGWHAVLLSPPSPQATAFMDAVAACALGRPELGLNVLKLHWLRWRVQGESELNELMLREVQLKRQMAELQQRQIPVEEEEEGAGGGRGGGGDGGSDGDGKAEGAAVQGGGEDGEGGGGGAAAAAAAGGGGGLDGDGDGDGGFYAEWRSVAIMAQVRRILRDRFLLERRLNAEQEDFAAAVNEYVNKHVLPAGRVHRYSACWSAEVDVEAELAAAAAAAAAAGGREDDGAAAGASIASVVAPGASAPFLQAQVLSLLVRMVFKRAARGGGSSGGSRPPTDTNAVPDAAGASSSAPSASAAAAAAAGAGAGTGMTDTAAAATASEPAEPSAFESAMRETLASVASLLLVGSGHVAAATRLLAAAPLGSHVHRAALLDRMWALMGAGSTWVRSLPYHGVVQDGTGAAVPLDGSMEAMEAAPGSRVYFLESQRVWMVDLEEEEEEEEEDESDEGEEEEAEGEEEEAEGDEVEVEDGEGEGEGEAEEEGGGGAEQEEGEQQVAAAGGGVAELDGGGADAEQEQEQEPIPPEEAAAAAAAGAAAPEAAAAEPGFDGAHPNPQDDDQEQEARRVRLLSRSVQFLWAVSSPSAAAADAAADVDAEVNSLHFASGDLASRGPHPGRGFRAQPGLVPYAEAVLAAVLQDGAPGAGKDPNPNPSPSPPGSCEVWQASLFTLMAACASAPEVQRRALAAVMSMRDVRSRLAAAVAVAAEFVQQGQASLAGEMLLTAYGTPPPPDRRGGGEGAAAAAAAGGGCEPMEVDGDGGGGAAAGESGGGLAAEPPPPPPILDFSMTISGLSALLWACAHLKLAVRLATGRARTNAIAAALCSQHSLTSLLPDRDRAPAAINRRDGVAAVAAAADVASFRDACVAFPAEEARALVPLMRALPGPFLERCMAEAPLPLDPTGVARQLLLSSLGRPEPAMGAEEMALALRQVVYYSKISPAAHFGPLRAPPGAPASSLERDLTGVSLLLASLVRLLDIDVDPLTRWPGGRAAFGQHQQHQQHQQQQHQQQHQQHQQQQQQQQQAGGGGAAGPGVGAGGAEGDGAEDEEEEEALPDADGGEQQQQQQQPAAAVAAEGGGVPAVANAAARVGARPGNNTTTGGGGGCGGAGGAGGSGAAEDWEDLGEDSEEEERGPEGEEKEEEGGGAGAGGGGLGPGRTDGGGNVVMEDREPPQAAAYPAEAAAEAGAAGDGGGGGAPPPPARPYIDPLDLFLLDERATARLRRAPGVLLDLVSEAQDAGLVPVSSPAGVCSAADAAAASFGNNGGGDTGACGGAHGPGGAGTSAGCAAAAAAPAVTHGLLSAAAGSPAAAAAWRRWPRGLIACRRLPRLLADALGPEDSARVLGPLLARAAGAFMSWDLPYAVVLAVHAARDLGPELLGDSGAAMAVCSLDRLCHTCTRYRMARTLARLGGGAGEHRTRMGAAAAAGRGRRRCWREFARPWSSAADGGGGGGSGGWRLPPPRTSWCAAATLLVRCFSSYWRRGLSAAVLCMTVMSAGLPARDRVGPMAQLFLLAAFGATPPPPPPGQPSEASADGTGCGGSAGGPASAAGSGPSSTETTAAATSWWLCGAATWLDSSVAAAAPAPAAKRDRLLYMLYDVAQPWHCRLQELAAAALGDSLPLPPPPQPPPPAPQETHAAAAAAMAVAASADVTTTAMVTDRHQQGVGAATETAAAACTTAAVLPALSRPEGVDAATTAATAAAAAGGSTLPECCTGGARNGPSRFRTACPSATTSSKSLLLPLPSPGQRAAAAAANGGAAGAAGAGFRQPPLPGLLPPGLYLGDGPEARFAHGNPGVRAVMLWTTVMMAVMGLSPNNRASKAQAEELGMAPYQRVSLLGLAKVLEVPRLVLTTLLEELLILSLPLREEPTPPPPPQQQPPQQQPPQQPPDVSGSDNMHQGDGAAGGAAGGCAAGGASTSRQGDPAAPAQDGGMGRSQGDGGASGHTSCSHCPHGRPEDDVTSRIIFVLTSRLVASVLSDCYPPEPLPHMPRLEAALQRAKEEAAADAATQQQPPPFPSPELQIEQVDGLLGVLSRAGYSYHGGGGGGGNGGSGGGNGGGGAGNGGGGAGNGGGGAGNGGSGTGQLEPGIAEMGSQAPA